MFDRLDRAAINGTTLAWRELGEGDPVVLVHGSASDLRTWDAQLERLGASFRVIAYSRRYARPNAPIDPGREDPIPVHVEDLVALLRTLNATPAHLVGHSWGGLVCLMAALAHPGVVRRLVLIEPPALTLFVTMPPRPPELLRTFLTHPGTALAILRFGLTAVAPAQRAFRRGDEQAALRAFGRGVLGREAFERLPRERLQQALENVATDRAQLLDSVYPPLDRAALRGLEVPTLLLHGERSPMLWHRLVRHLGELLPDSTRVEIPAASHILHEDNPGATSEAILGFLWRTAAAAPRDLATGAPRP
jgi:pimeloyl-ACP methyl ester carboxylesterase